MGEVSDIAISLNTPSPGTGYFAVQFCDPHRDEGETTDAWAVPVDADLNVSVLPDPAALPLPELATA